MNKYRDLTAADVLQAGDECLYEDYWADVHESNFGKTISVFSGSKCRRPLTLAEITAAERLKHELWVLSHCSDGYREKYLKESVEPKYEDGEYQDEDVQLSWKTWCAALGIDPTADLNRGG